ncbi:MAG: D-alanyl-D-alanine carboxypeptidase [Leifsonia flava]
MPLSRRQVYRRRRILVFSALALVLAAVIYGTTTLTAAVPATAASVTQPTVATQPAAQLTWPDFGSGAVGAVGFDGLLGSHGDPDAAVPIASITKVITALVVLDAKPIAAGEEGPTITYTDADVDIYYEQVAENASVAPVSAGLELSEKQSLTVMLLPSAGNYSQSLAIWAFGSVDAYLDAAQKWVADQGLTNTTVADTSGLSDSSASSPTDLVALAKIAVADPTLTSIVSQKSADIPGVGVVQNTNKMLGTHGVDGIKTGTNDNSGATLLFSAKYTVGSQSVTVVGAMLGGASMGDHDVLDAAVGTVLDGVAAGFHEVQLTTEGAPAATYTSLWGDTATAVSAKAASILTWSDTAVSGVAKAGSVQEAADGDTVGSLTFTVGEQTIEVPLVLMGSIKGPDAGWRLSHPGELAG